MDDHAGTIELAHDTNRQPNSAAQAAELRFWGAVVLLRYYTRAAWQKHVPKHGTNPPMPLKS
jgi:hypothetical protein